MSAEIHPFQGQPEDVDPQPVIGERSVYLDAYLAPFREWLDRDTVTEILVNGPGEVWVEDSARPGMQCHRMPEIDDRLIQRLAEQVARVSHQGINREHPLLGATRPLRPAVHGAMPDPQQEPIPFLREAIRQRRTILISGGTSTGKTTFLNAMLGEIPKHERVVLVEDTPELKLPGENGVGLVAVKGELGEAKVTSNELLQAALRLRPDRIVLGELRGSESVSFLRAINTGHPGSFSTIHANSLRGALEQLSLMVMQTGIGLTRSDTIAYAASVIDVLVQLGRDDRGGRGISHISLSADLV